MPARPLRGGLSLNCRVVSVVKYSEKASALRESLAAWLCWGDCELWPVAGGGGWCTSKMSLVISSRSKMGVVEAIGRLL